MHLLRSIALEILSTIAENVKCNKNAVTTEEFYWSTRMQNYSTDIGFNVVSEIEQTNISVFLASDVNLN